MFAANLTSGDSAVAVVTGQVVLTASSGTFVVPTNTYSISTLCVGRGGEGTGTLSSTQVDEYDWRWNTSTEENEWVYVGWHNEYSCTAVSGAGGNLSYVNNIVVTPGETLSYQIDGTRATLWRSGTAICSASSGVGNTIGTLYDIGTRYFGDVGENNSFTNQQFTSSLYARGGGAAGYAAGGNTGSGGAAASGLLNSATGGGGVGLLGQGTSAPVDSRLGGSGGETGGQDNGNSTNGGNYGGGAAATDQGGRTPGAGAIRIIWPGTTRQFPSTNTGDM